MPATGLFDFWMLNGSPLLDPGGTGNFATWSPSGAPVLQLAQNPTIVFREVTLPVDVKAGVALVSTLPVEYAGVVTVSRVVELPVDWAGQVGREVSLPVEWKTLIVATGELPVEYSGIPKWALWHQWNVIQKVDENLLHKWNVLVELLQGVPLVHQWLIRQGLIALPHSWRVVPQVIVSAFAGDVQKPGATAEIV
jgi:hypothetical protein